MLAGHHKAYYDVKIELTTDTNDALVGAVLDRHLDAAFVTDVPADTKLSRTPLFAERLKPRSLPLDVVASADRRMSSMIL